MTEREKLVELLREGLAKCSFYDQLADHLLAGGVMVSPVKVGQKLYTIPRSAIREWTVVGVWISADPMSSYAHLYWEKNGHRMGSCAVGFKDLNRTFFFSREEAEAALKEGQ